MHGRLGIASIHGHEPAVESPDSLLISLYEVSRNPVMVISVDGGVSRNGNTRYVGKSNVRGILVGGCTANSARRWLIRVEWLLLLDASSRNPFMPCRMPVLIRDTARFKARERPMIADGVAESCADHRG